jgi:hypothetical protein
LHAPKVADVFGDCWPVYRLILCVKDKDVEFVHFTSPQEFFQGS